MMISAALMDHVGSWQFRLLNFLVSFVGVLLMVLYLKLNVLVCAKSLVFSHSMLINEL